MIKISDWTTLGKVLFPLSVSKDSAPFGSLVSKPVVKTSWWQNLVSRLFTGWRTGSKAKKGVARPSQPSKSLPVT